ncbi:unnamed protein product [Fusarium graminearum]|uniref:Chromosome 1, complete genome n=1 Tax=Gibberella zeae (strain ATCC MYA-4620 / CBS 123657 / FGSC 9075 / NRRL 31084 / PH-1) TaxID=229533 RepID=A0A098D5J6_GIBZE|nr:unnamed protein product [Fusarium graminearum]
MSSHASTVMDRPHPFLSLPPEIITCIVDNMLEMNHDCEQPKWSCKTFYTLLIKQIYRTDVWNNNSAALLRSAKNGSLGGVRRPIEAGADITTGDTTESIVFSDINGEVEGLFLNTWYPLDLSDQVTTLHWAAYLGHNNVVSLLLEHGADVNHRVRVEFIDDAIERHSGHEEDLKSYPVKLSCDVLTDNLEHSLICLEGIPKEVARWTLEHGANPLYFAIEGGNWDTVKLLIDAGADFVTHTGGGIHALHQAVSNCNPHLVELLLEHESVAANTNTILDTRRATTLHHLNYERDGKVSKNCDIIKKLVKNGFQVNNTDGFDALPIEEAILNRSYKVVSQFIRSGSLIPGELSFRFYRHISPPSPEIQKALKEAGRSGLADIRHYSAPVIITMSPSMIRTYHNFYKLVYQASEIPEPMNSYDPGQWEAFWIGRPVHIKRKELGGLIEMRY